MSSGSDVSDEDQTLTDIEEGYRRKGMAEEEPMSVEDTLPPAQEALIEEALSYFYARAVAMHEGINAGQGAVAWHDQDNAAFLRDRFRKARGAVEAAQKGDTRVSITVEVSR